MVDVVLNVVGELVEAVQSLNCKVLRRGFVVLHALQVSNDILGTLFLLVDDALEIVVLLIDFVEDLVLQANLVCYSLLHLRALVLMVLAHLENLLELLDLLGGSDF